MTKALGLKKKLINHIMRDGKKKTSEKILLQSIKDLQKKSNKKSKKLVQISITNSTPVFKICKSNKKTKQRNAKVRETPVFIPKSQARTSLAFKFILSNIKERKSGNFNTKLTKAFLASAEGEGESIALKNELQKKVLLNNRRLFRYYKF